MTGLADGRRARAVRMDMLQRLGLPPPPGGPNRGEAAMLQQRLPGAPAATAR